jgi:hypothetical protein
MVEFRDANHVILKNHIDSMKKAIAASGDAEVQASLDAYEQKFGTTKWEKQWRNFVSYPIALYQALLYTKAAPETKKILGNFWPCGCGIDGIFGLQTLLTSGKVIKPIYPDFHGVVDATTLTDLMNMESISPDTEYDESITQTSASEQENTSSSASDVTNNESFDTTPSWVSETTTVSSHDESNNADQPPETTTSAPESELTPEQLDEAKKQLDIKTATTDALVAEGIQLKNSNDLAWAKRALQEAADWYSILIQEANAYNWTETDESKKIVVEELQMKLDDTNNTLNALDTAEWEEWVQWTESLEWVEGTDIDVEKTVEQMRDAYKIGLIANEIVNVRLEMQKDIFSKINKVERKNDLLETADFNAGFTSLEKQIRAAKTSADALKIRETGMGHILNPKFVITTEFDATGKPVKTGESLNRSGDDRKAIRSFLDNKLALTLPEITTRLASADVAKMWMTESPSFAWLDTDRKNALTDWDDAIKQLDAQEAKVASARGKVIALIDELGTKEERYRTVEGLIKAEKALIRKKTWGNSNELIKLEGELNTLNTRIDQLNDTNGVEGEITLANKALTKEKQTLEALKWPQWSEAIKGEAYAQAVDQYGDMTLHEVDTWNTENMWRTDAELVANKSKREQLTTSLETTKTSIASSIDAIQTAIDEGRTNEVVTLQGNRDQLIAQKTELEKSVADVDFADRVAYKREYTIVSWSLEAESNKLKDDENVLDEQLDAKQRRLTNALAGWSMAERTQTNADMFGIDQTEKDAAQDKESLAAEARQLLTDMYWGNPGVREEVMVPIVGGTEETRVIESVWNGDQVIWTATMEGSYRGIGEKTVQKELVDEHAPSLYGKKQFNQLQQKEVKDVHELMGMWNEWVDAEMRVHVLQQQIDIADQDKTVWKEAEATYQDELNEIDTKAASTFTNIKTYTGVEDSYKELTDRYFENKTTRTKLYYDQEKNNPTFLKEQLALRKSYNEFIDLHAPAVTTAKSVIQESQTKQKELTTRIASLGKQLTTYAKKLNDVDTKKTTKQQALNNSTNSYWTEYKETLVDPKGRTNEDEKTTTD